MYIKNLQYLLKEFKIEKVINEYYPNWDGKSKICCPFHKEKTPSYSISISKNISTCFGGCGTFSPVNFVKEMDNCTFLEAVEKCAKLNRLEVEYDKRIKPEDVARQKEKQNKLLSLYNTNGLVAKRYMDAAYKGKIPDTVNIVDDKQTRSLSKATIKKFQVCVTPEDWKFLQKAKLDEQALLDLGLIRSNNNGGHFDVFRHRILYPIHGQNNQILGFAGRKMTADKEYPKFWNSQESLVYKKQEILYGLYPQANAIRKQQQAYLAEGYMDVLTPYDMGFEGVVANCGTALNEKQAALLKRFTKRVCWLADNDEDKETNAGLNAVIKGLPILLKQGLHVDVVIFPSGEDPDSYCRSVGIEAFRGYIKDNQTDAVLWRAEALWNESNQDPFAQVTVANDIIALLVLINNENLVDAYCKRISKLMGMKQSAFSLQLRNAQDKSLSSYDDLTQEQENSKRRYRLYEQNNRMYCVRSDDNTDIEVANFVVNPLFHLASKENPKRLFEIVNEVGQRRVIETDTNNLVSLDRFKNTVEAEGNYVFTGVKAYYDRLKRKIYDMMQTCYEIDTLGYHNDGFYVFGNGIYTIDKGFVEIDRYGVVMHEEKQYFLPAFSDIYKGSDGFFDEEKNFLYAKSPIDFEEWAKLFIEVHGDKGIITMCFYLAALFRSHIRKYAKVPLLNLFGMPQSGKSFLGENIVAMFGKEAKGLNIHSCTDVAFANKLVVGRDTIILLEEYKNNIPEKKVEGLKDVFDGLGRERGQKSSSKNKRTQVHSTCILSGQELPTADPALFTRCISLAFAKTEYKQKQKEKADALYAMRGKLTHITANIFTLRPIIEEQFGERYKQNYAELRNHCQNQKVSTRMIENNAVLLSIFGCLQDKLKFPFDDLKLFNTLSDNLFRQNIQMGKENEVSVFWSIIEYLSVSREINYSEDYVIKAGHKEHGDKMLLYLSFSKAFGLYLKNHRQQHNKQGLSKASLQHYLKSHHAFIDVKKSCRIGKKNSSAFVFDYKKLGIHLANEPLVDITEDDWEDAKEQIKKTKKVHA